MIAGSNAKAEAKFFTDKRRNQLTKLLKKAKPWVMQDKAIDRMESLAAKFSEDIRRLGFRPFIEDWDRCLSSESYQERFDRRVQLSSAESKRKQLLGIKKADLLLKGLITNVARCWKETTGQPLPKLTAEVLERCGVGYWPELAVVAATHPLWLIFDAVELKVSGWTVNQLVCDARLRAGENIEVPNMVGPVTRPVKPQRLH
jgi:hypothetical protein